MINGGDNKMHFWNKVVLGCLLILAAAAFDCEAVEVHKARLNKTIFRSYGIYAPEDTYIYDDEIFINDFAKKKILLFPHALDRYDTFDAYDAYIEITAKNSDLARWMLLLSDEELEAIDAQGWFRGGVEPTLKGRLNTLRFPLVTGKTETGAALIDDLFTVVDDYAILHGVAGERDFYIKNFDYVKFKGMPFVVVPTGGGEKSIGRLVQ
ncbi:MAG: hypothetical protein GY850_25215 [bacterium]|nr:hypothetical protein [bacterium]